MVLKTRSNTPSGNGRLSAVAWANVIRLPAGRAALAYLIISAAASTPSSRANGNIGSAARSNRPVPHPTSRIAPGFGTSTAAISSRVL